MSAETVKFLNFWWEPDSVLDPTQATKDYFKVSYDDQARYTWVERYNASHQLLTRDHFYWDGARIARVDLYDPATSALQKFIEWEYDQKGEPSARQHYSPTGQLLRREKIE